MRYSHLSPHLIVITSLALLFYIICENKVQEYCLFPNFIQFLRAEPEIQIDCQDGSGSSNTEYKSKVVFLQKHIKKHVRVFLQCRINNFRLSFELPVQLAFKYKIKSLFVVILYAMKCDPAGSLNPRCFLLNISLSMDFFFKQWTIEFSINEHVQRDLPQILQVVSEKEFQIDEAIITFYQNNQKSLNLFGWTRSGLFFIQVSSFYCSSLYMSRLISEAQMRHQEISND